MFPCSALQVQRGRSAVFSKILQCSVRTDPLQCSAGAVQKKCARDISKAKLSVSVSKIKNLFDVNKRHSFQLGLQTNLEIWMSGARVM